MREPAEIPSGKRELSLFLENRLPDVFPRPETLLGLIQAINRNLGVVDAARDRIAESLIGPGDGTEAYQKLKAHITADIATRKMVFATGFYIFRQKSGISFSKPQQQYAAAVLDSLVGRNETSQEATSIRDQLIKLTQGKLKTRRRAPLTTKIFGEDSLLSPGLNIPDLENTWRNLLNFFEEVETGRLGIYLNQPVSPEAVSGFSNN